MKVGGRYRPAIKVVTVRIGDHIYDVGKPPMPHLPPITVKVVAVTPSATAHHLHIRHPSFSGIETRSFHPSSYVPVPISVYRAHKGGVARVDVSMPRTKKLSPSAEMRIASVKAQGVGSAAMQNPQDEIVRMQRQAQNMGTGTMAMRPPKVPPVWKPKKIPSIYD